MSTCLGRRTQPHSKDGQSHCPLSLGTPGRSAAWTASTKPRAGKPRPPVAEDDLMAALRWPRPSKQPDAPQGTTYVVWSDHLQRPGPPGQACSYPVWTASKEARDEDSSVSSGRLSGSSGGHKSCAPSHRPWKERSPQLLGSPQQHRKSSPRLEQLRDKIRAQAHWQASCASLGTSMPSSASHPLRASAPAPQKKVRKLKKPPPAAAYPDFGNLSAAEDKVGAGPECEPSGVSQRQASVRREKTKSTRSTCKREKAPTLSSRRAAKDKADTEEGAAESPIARPRMPRPASVRSSPQVAANMPHLAACDQIVTIQSAMAILQDLRQQIQTGLELAQDRHLRGAPGCRPSTLWRQEPAGRRHRGPWTAPDVKMPLTKSPRAPTKGVHSSAERTGSFPARPRWSTLARCESYPQRTWSAQGRDPPFQRPGSPPERLGYFPQRPWSASAGQRAWVSSEDGEAPARGPWHPVDRPSPAAQRAWSASFIKRAGTPFKGRGSLLPPWGGKNTWPRPAQSTPQMAPGKENEAQLPLPCPKPRGPLGHPHSPESLRQFMRQKALAHRQQALEEKASATRALGLRDQRLQDVYRKQREAILGKAVPTKAFPVVSQTTPSIVTFVPHSAPTGGLEAPGSLGPPALQWSKVTSGMVLGDQEAPGSFCLCLDRALNRDETLETGGPQEGWEGVPLLMSASSSLGPLKLRDLSTPHVRPGLCIYLDPEEAERLGTPGPLHFRYKQARLQALETMANVLKQRIDVLTAKLLGSEAVDTLEDLVSALPPPRPSTMPAARTPAAPACPGALVPNRSRGAPWVGADMPARPRLSPSCFPDGQMLWWSPGWEQQRSVSPGGHPAHKPRGFTEDACLELDKKLARNSASFRVLSPLPRR